MNKKIIECVPNFSEGRDQEVIEEITDCFKNNNKVKLLDYSADFDHNRMVITVIGEPDGLFECISKAVNVSTQKIDITRHEGEHPKIGACDVIPFIPISGCDMNDAIYLAKKTGEEIANRYEIPVFLYEEAAKNEQRKNLAEIRKGGIKGLEKRIEDGSLLPDFGPHKIHQSAGAIAVSARNILCAFNVNLDTDDIKIADEIAKKIRYSNGGLPFCKAIAINLETKGIVQVSMNLTNYKETSIFKAFTLIKDEAEKRNVKIHSSEAIGLLPQKALIDCAIGYLKLEDFDEKRIIENRIGE